MIVSKIEEILEVLPTGRWKDPHKLFSAIADEEYAVLQPILGDRLMQHLTDKYTTLLRKFNLITSAALDVADVQDEERRYIMMLRQLQKCVVLRMMANNSTILSSSFNEGGGLNRMSTDGYEAVSVEELRELRNEYWHNSNRAIDIALHMLELDATGEKPLFSEMWKESEYYFHHADLIFPTLRSLQPYYSMIKDEKHIEFIDLLPDIRWCQNTYILPMYGNDLVELLITEAKDVCKKALQLTRLSLAIFLKVRTTKNPPTLLEPSAHQALQTAIKYMQQHIEELMPAIQGSQFYEEKKHCHGHNKKPDAERKKYNTFSKLF